MYASMSWFLSHALLPSPNPLPTSTPYRAWLPQSHATVLKIPAVQTLFCAPKSTVLFSLPFIQLPLLSCLMLSLPLPYFPMRKC
jgi:hypothetical protein